MEIKLTGVSGIPHSLAALTMSKRHFDAFEYEKLIIKYNQVTDHHGFFKYPNDELILKELNLLAKWGAGVGIDCNYDGGHETLLRYIDFTFIVKDLHRGAMDDLDSHAKRFENRIIRTSTRLAKYTDGEVSDWYKDKIRSAFDAAHIMSISIPDEFIDENDVTWVKASYGYVRSDVKNRTDVLRGNYPLSIPMSAIMRINLVDLRHVYMRRNKYTGANPELRLAVESLADQIEEAIPGDLGKLIRYDYAYDSDLNKARLVHVMDIRKEYHPRTSHEMEKRNEG